LNANGVAVIQAWVDGVRPNRGLILANPAAGDGLGFSSSEATPPTVRPRLTIVYTMAPLDTDGDGLSDSLEVTLGTNPLLPDTDGDRLNDGVEIAHGSNPLDPASYPSLADGDLAPLGSPDGSINAADYLLSLRLTLGLLTPTVLELAHGDLYPPGNPDGLINLSDTLLQQQLLFASP
jgi:Bacterial TSP3 repeat